MLLKDEELVSSFRKTVVKKMGHYWELLISIIVVIVVVIVIIGIGIGIGIGILCCDHAYSNEKSKE